MQFLVYRHIDLLAGIGPRRPATSVSSRLARHTEFFEIFIASGFDGIVLTSLDHCCRRWLPASLAALSIVASRNIFVSAAGTTANFMMDFFSAVANSGWDTAIKQALTSDLVPSTVQQRLMLWADALEIWRRHPIFGASASWLTEWQDRTYHPEIYDVFHNGYLEIAVRYGFVGLLFYAFLFTWASMQVLRAARAKLIELSAWHCYISTLVGLPP